MFGMVSCCHRVSKQQFVTGGKRNGLHSSFKQSAMSNLVLVNSFSPRADQWVNFPYIINKFSKTDINPWDTA